MRVMALYNIKGGTGKTAAAVNLAFLSSLEGKRTLLWDLDPQGAVAYYFDSGGELAPTSWHDAGISQHIRRTSFESLDLLSFDAANLTQCSSKRVAQLSAVLERQYDNVFLDCPHSSSDVAAIDLAAPGALLVPTIPTPLSIRTLAQLHAELAHRGRTGVRLLPFFCMVDRRKKLHRSTGLLAEALPLTMLETEIPYASQVERMAIERAPLARFARTSKPARAYERLWDEIQDVLGRSSPRTAVTNRPWSP